MILGFKKYSLAILITLCTGITMANLTTVNTPHPGITPSYKPKGSEASKKNILFDEKNADWLDLHLSDVSGKKLTLRTWLKERKKPVLLVLSATWCPPCMHELPSLARMGAKLNKELGVLVVFIDEISERQGEKLQLIPNLEKLNLSSQNLLMYYGESANQIMRKRGLKGLPSFILFSPTGSIWMTDSGAKNWMDDGVQQWLLNIIHKNTFVKKQNNRKEKIIRNSKKL